MAFLEDTQLVFTYVCGEQLMLKCGLFEPVLQLKLLYLALTYHQLRLKTIRASSTFSCCFDGQVDIFDLCAQNACRDFQRVQLLFLLHASGQKLLFLAQDTMKKSSIFDKLLLSTLQLQLDRLARRCRISASKLLLIEAHDHFVIALRATVRLLAIRASLQRTSHGLFVQIQVLMMCCRIVCMLATVL